MASGTAKYRYMTDAGNIFYARTDDSVSLTAIRGQEPAGAITESITFKVSKTSKELGCSPRHVKLYLKSTDTSDGCLVNPKTVVKNVVVLSPAHVVTAGAEVTVNGRVWIVGSIVGEQMR